MLIDIIVGAILLISAVISFIRGFIREILTIVGVVGGLLSSYFFAAEVSTYIEELISPDIATIDLDESKPKLFDIIPYDTAADIMAYGAVFIAVVGILSVISHFAAEGLRKFGLGALDRTLGVIFGLLRGVLFLGLLYLPVHMLVEKDTADRWFDGSRSYMYLDKTAGFIGAFLPSGEDASLQEDKDLESEQSPFETISDEMGTRKVLKELEVLKDEVQEQGADALNQINSEAGDAASQFINDTTDIIMEKMEDPVGYDESFRNQMDDLFKDE